MVLLTSRLQITAFKTGQYPAVTNDQIYIWSRPHPHDATPSAPSMARPTNWQDTDDNLYAFVFAMAASTVTLTAGTNTRSFTVSPGVTKLSLTSGAGAISGSIVRSGSTVASVSSAGSFSYSSVHPIF